MFFKPVCYLTIKETFDSNGLRAPHRTVKLGKAVIVMTVGGFLSSSSSDRRVPVVGNNVASIGERTTVISPSSKAPLASNAEIGTASKSRFRSELWFIFYLQLTYFRLTHGIFVFFTQHFDNSLLITRYQISNKIDCDRIESVNSSSLYCCLLQIKS